MGIWLGNVAAYTQWALKQDTHCDKRLIPVSISLSLSKKQQFPQNAFYRCQVKENRQKHTFSEQKKGEDYKQLF